MRKRNLLIFTLVVVLMTAMSAPVFAGSQGDRPEHKRTHTDKVYAAKKRLHFGGYPPSDSGRPGACSGPGKSGCRKEDHAVHYGVSAEIFERSLDHRGQMDRESQWENLELDPQAEDCKGAVHGKKCFHRPKRPGQRYLGGLQQGAFLQEKIKNN